MKVVEVSFSAFGATLLFSIVNTIEDHQYVEGYHTGSLVMSQLRMELFVKHCLDLLRALSRH
jgi:hypothetical protein